MIILGIDGSLNSTGWALVDGDTVLDSGVIRLTHRAGAPPRHAQLRDSLVAIIQDRRPCATLHDRKPNAIYTEGHAQVAYRRDRSRSMRMVEALGEVKAAVEEAAYLTGVPLRSIPVHHWRLLFCGSIMASKPTVWRVLWLQHLVATEEPPKDSSALWDQAEATAIALVGARLERQKGER